MRASDILLGIITLAISSSLSSCNNPVEFRGAPVILKPVVPEKDSGDQRPALTLPATFRFKLQIGDGSGLIRQGSSLSLTTVYHDDETQALAGDEAAAWKVELTIANSEAQSGELGERNLNFSDESGVTNVQAIFNHRDGRTGSLNQTVFVDGEAPKASLLELAMTPAGDKNVYWSASDNYQINPQRTTIYACIEGIEPNSVRSFDEFEKLPTHCSIVYKPEELASQGEQIQLSAHMIGGIEYAPSQLSVFIYVEDMVGLSSVVPLSPAAKNAALLTLDSPIRSIQYSRQTSLKVPLTLSLLDQSQIYHIDQLKSDWSLYKLSLARSPSILETTQSFESEINLPLGASDGLYLFKIKAQQANGDTRSNERSFSVILDRIAPSLKAGQIDVPNGVLEDKALISVDWLAEDSNGIVRQTIEIQSKGENTWSKIADISGSSRKFQFPWNKDRPNKGFSLRISATDPAGNSSQAVTQWSPQIFNAAVLTSSVECFYCHIQIEGDVGGINFPSNEIMDKRGDSGQQFYILGKLYATNAIPDLFKRQITAKNMKVDGGLVENYDNSGVKIFPSQKDANGVPVFPALSIDSLKERMNGTVSNGNGTRYSRIYSGNLVLTGTASNPIITNGEFLVDGDLVIKGVYKGIGSIYAKNVYIVNDLVSSDCVAGSADCPYPFAGATDEEKIASAKSAIQMKRSALYLAGLQQTVVGGISKSWGFPLADPYSWFPLSDYQNLCTQGAYLLDPTKDPKVPNPTDPNWPFLMKDGFYNPTNSADLRARCEVNRVDAFIYGHDLIAWRSYGNYLINGGFVGYKAALLSTVPYRTHSLASSVKTINPRNGMPANRNVIRYDWRLRAGGAGFESLKALFDQ